MYDYWWDSHVVFAGSRYVLFAVVREGWREVHRITSGYPRVISFELFDPRTPLYNGISAFYADCWYTVDL